MVPPGLESLGQPGNAARKNAARKEDVAGLEWLDVTRPFDVSYCVFDEPFFNTGNRTLSLENHFQAGDRDAEGVVKRMVMHPNAFLEVVLESKLVPGKITTVILFKPKNCTPSVTRYRSIYAQTAEEKQ